jgi:L-threonylcarbamoyladenylate synthase
MMKLILMDRDNPGPEIARAIEVLEAGGVVAYPTETLYGLGADARNEAAVTRVRRIKGRDPHAPVSVIAADPEMAREWVEMNALAERLVEQFWPGPLTLILPLRSRFGKYLIGSAAGLGIRVPGLASARRLCSELGAPITATSANPGHEENLLTAKEIERHLGDELDLILDAGRLEPNPGSTVLDLVSEPPRILREGVMPSADLLKFI